MGKTLRNKKKLSMIEKLTTGKHVFLICIFSETEKTQTMLAEGILKIAKTKTTIIFSRKQGMARLVSQYWLT